MLILTINCGSSSVKFQLLEVENKTTVKAKGIIDGIGLSSCKVIFNEKEETKKIKTHKKALRTIFHKLKKQKIIKKFNEIDAVGHRVVHGGEKYKDPTKLTAKVIKEIKALSRLAPLHNPVNLEGILATKKILPKTPQVAVFDTAFHQTMPEKAFLYGLPYTLYKNHGIRRYGFHGTSHKYVIHKTLEHIKKKKAKIITCHLGNGSSITAFDKDHVLDTSMGFTPLEGIVMGTRSGSIDPAISIYLEENFKLTPPDIDEILNHQSGLKGLSGISSDMRVLYETSKGKNAKKAKQAKLAIEVLSYQIAKYCGAYAAAMNGIDALTFTGGIGEHAYYVRETVCKHLEFIGLKFNKKANKNNSLKISTPKSKVQVFIIPTNEEKQIAKETKELLES